MAAALDEGALRVLRQNLPDNTLDGSGAPLAAALVASPEATARSMDLMEMKIDTLQQELERLVRGSGGGPAASGGRVLMAKAQRLRAGVGGIQARLGEAHASVGPGLELPLAVVEAAAAGRSELLQKVQTHDQLAGVMAALALLKAAVAEHEAAVASGDLDAAARKVCSLEGMLQDEPLAGLVASGVRALSAVGAMIAGKRAELADLASTFVRQSFVVGRRGSGADTVVRCRFRRAIPMPSVARAQPTGGEALRVRLSVAWACLDTLGGGSRTMCVQALAKAMHTHFIDPLFARPAATQRAGGEGATADLTWSLVVDSPPDDGESGGATLRASSDPQLESETGNQLLGPLAELVEVLCAVNCDSDPSLCGAFGSEMWPRLTEQLAESGCLGAQDAEAVSAFETRLRKLGFVVEVTATTNRGDSMSVASGSGTKDITRGTVVDAPSLVGHVEGLRNREAKEVCGQLLQRARETLLNEDTGSSTAPAGGKYNQAVLFAFPPCETSASSRCIAGLLKECGEIAASQYADEPGAAEAALQTIDQLLDLFRATHAGRILPHGSTAGPGPSAVLHNDYMLLGHCCLTLGFEFRPALSQCSFASRVPGLRALADGALASYTTAVEGELRSHFDETRSFAEVWEPKRAATATKALEKIIYELEKLGRVWAPPVLPATSYALAIGGLLGKAASWIVAAVLRLAEDDMLCYKPDSLESLYATITLFVEKAPALLKFASGADDPAGTMREETCFPMREETCWAAAGQGWRRCRACEDYTFASSVSIWLYVILYMLTRDVIRRSRADQTGAQRCWCNVASWWSTGRTHRYRVRVPHCLTTTVTLIPLDFRPVAAA